MKMLQQACITTNLVLPKILQCLLLQCTSSSFFVMRDRDFEGGGYSNIVFCGEEQFQDISLLRAGKLLFLIVVSDIVKVMHTYTLYSIFMKFTL